MRKEHRKTRLAARRYPFPPRAWHDPISCEKHAGILTVFILEKVREKVTRERVTDAFPPIAGHRSGRYSTAAPRPRVRTWSLAPPRIQTPGWFISTTAPMRSALKGKAKGNGRTFKACQEMRRPHSSPILPRHRDASQRKAASEIYIRKVWIPHPAASAHVQTVIFPRKSSRGHSQPSVATSETSFMITCLS